MFEELFALGSSLLEDRKNNYYGMRQNMRKRNNCFEEAQRKKILVLKLIHIGDDAVTISMKPT